MCGVTYSKNAGKDGASGAGGMMGLLHVTSTSFLGVEIRPATCSSVDDGSSGPQSVSVERAAG